MPIYEYICSNCDNELEEVQKFSEPLLTLCPECNTNELTRKPSVSAFHLKGGGWYKDGYNGTSNKPEETKPEETKSEESKSEESKSEEPKKNPPAKESSPPSSDKSKTTSSETSSPTPSSAA